MLPSLSNKTGLENKAQEVILTFKKVLLMLNIYIILKLAFFAPFDTIRLWTKGSNWGVLDLSARLDETGTQG